MVPSSLGLERIPTYRLKRYEKERSADICLRSRLQGRFNSDEQFRPIHSRMASITAPFRFRLQRYGVLKILAILKSW